MRTTSRNTVNQVSFIKTVNNQIQGINKGVILDQLAKDAERHEDILLPYNEIIDGVLDKRFIFSDNSKSQFYQKLGTSETFMSKFDKSPQLKIEVARHLASLKKDNSLVRFYNQDDGKKRMRAILSSEYTKLDVLPVMENLFKRFDDNLTVRSLSNNDYYFSTEIILGDPIETTINGKPEKFYNIMRIRNSETGLSTLNLMAGILRQVCTNGMCRQITGINASFKHIFKDMNEVFAILGNVSDRKIIEDSSKIVDLYMNASGVFVPKENLDKEYEAFVDEIDMGKKPMKTLEMLRSAKYSSNSMFDITNAITETIWRTTDSVDKRLDMEEKTYTYASNRVKELSK